MADAPSDQAKAEALIRALVPIADSPTALDSHHYPQIDYAGVSTESCYTLTSMLRCRGDKSGATVPKTPKREKVARRIDYQLARRRLQSAEEQLSIFDRILTSQDLEDNIVENIELVCNFLRAARQPHLDFAFPKSQIELVRCFKRAHEALYEAEDLMKGSFDSEETEPDSDGPESGNTTLTGYTTA
ncbi:hypothetical protein C8R46DRAFT_377067 [Mycena filopes]|nr:hypothetical protein C8R46DRAFT_377067 [Mycena filopes]